MAFLFGSTSYADSIDRATSENLPQGDEDVALNLEISDLIKSKAFSAKDAIRLIKRKINASNPNVQLLALKLTDVCVKNSGKHFILEVATKDFMDILVALLRVQVSFSCIGE